MKRKCKIISIVLATIIILNFTLSPLEMVLYSNISCDLGSYHHAYLTVVLNRLYVRNWETCSEKIIEKCRENNFSNMKFNYDHSIPNELSIHVYLSEWHVEHNRPLYFFKYEQKNRTCSVNYDIVNHPEQFEINYQNIK